jgi:hypothetical protein
MMGRSGSVLLNSGSESGLERPKNLRILRIRNTAFYNNNELKDFRQVLQFNDKMQTVITRRISNFVKINRLHAKNNKAFAKSSKFKKPV